MLDKSVVTNKMFKLLGKGVLGAGVVEVGAEELVCARTNWKVVSMHHSRVSNR